MSHPKDRTRCDCGVRTWTQTDRPRAIGPTYECTGCGREVYIYDTSDVGGRGRREFRDVTTGYLRIQYFRHETGTGPRNYFAHEVSEPLNELPEHIAIDYWMIECSDWTQSAWADTIGISQQAVSKNVRKARDHLDD